MVWAQKTFVPRDGLHAHSHYDPCSFLDFMLVNSCVQVPLDKHRVSWKTVAIKYNCIAAHLRTCKLVFNKLEGQISCKSAPPTLCPYGVGGTWNISGSKEITIISQDMYSASANFLSTARSPLWEVLAAVHYSAMLLHWLAPALFTDRGVCLLPAGAGLLWSSLLNTLHRATQQLGPQHPQQLRVRSHCLDGSNRSVFCSPVSHFAPLWAILLLLISFVFQLELVFIMKNKMNNLADHFAFVKNKGFQLLHSSVLWQWTGIDVSM